MFRDADNKIICESVTISSELQTIPEQLSLRAVIIDHLREKQHLPLKINPIVRSDGCSAQFQSRFAFELLSSIDSLIQDTTPNGPWMALEELASIVM